MIFPPIISTFAEELLGRAPAGYIFQGLLVPEVLHPTRRCAAVTLRGVTNPCAASCSPVAQPRGAALCSGAQRCAVPPAVSRFGWLRGADPHRFACCGAVVLPRTSQGFRLSARLHSSGA